MGLAGSTPARGASMSTREGGAVCSTATPFSQEARSGGPLAFRRCFSGQLLLCCAGPSDVVADFLGRLGGDEELFVTRGEQSFLLQPIVHPAQQRRPQPAFDEDPGERLDPG